MLPGIDAVVMAVCPMRPQCVVTNDLDALELNSLRCQRSPWSGFVMPQEDGLPLTAGTGTGFPHRFQANRAHVPIIPHQL
jgi:hypothetical protein